MQGREEGARGRDQEEGKGWKRGRKGGREGKGARLVGEGKGVGAEREKRRAQRNR